MVSVSYCLLLISLNADFVCELVGVRKKWYLNYSVCELLPFLYCAGCSSGIGVETARALHATGAHLFLTVRDMKKVRPYVDLQHFVHPC
jgi:hypothetical protein